MVDTYPRDEGNHPQHTHHGGHQSGCISYQKHPHPIVIKILPNSTEAWHLFALAYNEESRQEFLHAEDEVDRNW